MRIVIEIHNISLLISTTRVSISSRGKNRKNRTKIPLLVPPRKRDVMRVFFTVNCRSVKYMTVLIIGFIFENDVDVMEITETWLDTE